VSIPIQVMSAHPLLIRAVEGVLSNLRDIPVRLLPPVQNPAEAMKHPRSPRLFLLDACSLRSDLGTVAGRCRTYLPGSKFLALLPPEKSSTAEKTRLFYWGIDGFVELHETWQVELPKAIQSLVSGQTWAPPEVMLAFVERAKWLLDAQLLPGHSLTAREGQTLQLLMRKLTNKEISGALGISERTVKYHVSNILSKLQLQDRRRLAPDNLLLKFLPSE
jgi:DNA-binding NarL/FixJ family response regulator